MARLAASPHRGWFRRMDPRKYPGIGGVATANPLGGTKLFSKKTGNVIGVVIHQATISAPLSLAPRRKSPFPVKLTVFG